TSDAGPGVAMSTGTANDFKWIIKQNGDKYNIFTEDETLLLRSTGVQAGLIENTETNRNDESVGALVTFQEVSTGTRFKTPTGDGGEVMTWNSNRSGATFVGMGAQQNESAQWNLIRLGDLVGDPNANTWTGEASTAWEVAGNWSKGTVPTSEDSVVIANATNKPVIASGDIKVASLELSNAAILTVSSGASLSITANLTAPGSGSVEVESGASLLTFGSVSGTSHVFKRNTTFDNNTAQYSVIGSPVVGASTSSLGLLVYSYDETKSYSVYRFTEVENPETMAGGDAYFSAFTGEVTFTGTPHTGNVSIDLAYDAADGDNAGFNLVSNPYPAAIDFKTLVTNNTGIDGTIYLWDDGGSATEKRTAADYITVNMVGEVGSEVATATGGSGRSGSFNGSIGSAQGFFVKANDVSQTLNFTNDMKVTGSNADANFFRKAISASDIQSVKLSLTDADGFSNQSLVGFIADASTGFDRLYDAHKVDGLNGVKFYSLMGDSPLAIQGLPIADETVIPLGFSVEVAGEYTLEIEDIANLSEGKFIYLEDTQLGKITKLEKGDEYTFTSGAGVDESRFNLIVTNAMSVLALDDLDNQGLNVLYTRRGLTISNASAKVSQAQVSISDISGALLFKKSIGNLKDKEVIDYEFSSNRVYILRVTTESNSYVTKFAFD
ncbi:MAG: hypothetical protein RIA69_13265, partial [Cyclobacteriaceae bacterium]